MNKTNIEYLDYTWNVTHGCSPISDGCAHCWAEVTAKRIANMGTGARGYSKDDPFKVTCCPWELDEPLKIKKPSRIGVSFMGDLFHEDVPYMFINDVVARISACEQHQFLILTKRPDRMLEWMTEKIAVLYEKWPLPNLWPGVTVESDKYLWRIEELLKIPAAKHFVSLEPLLSGIDLKLLPDYSEWKKEGFSKDEMIEMGPPKPDWFIIGAESGPKRRECKIEWVRDIVGQCAMTKTPLFIKQLDINGKLSKNMAEWPEDLRVREYPTE